MSQHLPPESFVCRLRSRRSEEWDLYRCHEPTGLCQLRLRREPDDAEPGTRLRCLEIRTADAATEWLRVCATDSDDMRTLRDVLRDETLPLSRFGNHQVIEQVAAMVARRALCVVVSLPAVQSAFFEKASEAPARRVPTPAQLRPRIEEAPKIFCRRPYAGPAGGRGVGMAGIDDDWRGSLIREAFDLVAAKDRVAVLRKSSKRRTRQRRSR